MASSVTEENITKLREAGYLVENIAHRLPTEGHITPTLKSRERVVFLPHFVRGLDFHSTRLSAGLCTTMG